jgi:hypothetical protein
VSDIYDLFTQFTYDICEEGSLQLGIVTQQEFLDILNLVLLDMAQKTALIKTVDTQSVFAGVSQYTVPEEILDVEDVFVAGKQMPMVDRQALNSTIRNWRNEMGFPRFVHEDGLPVKTVEVVPTPIFNGLYITGGSEPNPPHAQAAFDVTVLGSVYRPDQSRGLTLVGSEKPDVVATVSQDLALLPADIVLAYALFGVEARVFSGDNELKDAGKAMYCASRYTEGLNLLRAVLQEYED